jgi:hypothetical protein
LAKADRAQAERCTAKPVHKERTDQSPAHHVRKVAALMNAFKGRGERTMPEIKQSRSAEETIARRMRNSGGEEADKVISGEGVRRVYHNIHLSGSAKHGADNPGEGDIHGHNGERR